MDALSSKIYLPWLFSLLCHQLRIFVNQMEAPSESNTDLLAIRMASVNPILDPWIYILLRKTVVLKLMEKIKCLFCKMGGRGRRNGGQFRCADGRLSSSIVSRDSPSLVSRELQEMVCTSQTFLYPSEGNPREQCSSSPPAAQTLQGSEEVEGPPRGLSQSDLEDTEPDRLVRDLPVCLKDPTLHVTFTDEMTNIQEKCI